MEPFEEIKQELKSMRADMGSMRADMGLMRADFATRLDAVEGEQRSQRDTIAVLAENVVAVNRSLEILTAAHVEIGRSIAAQMLAFERTQGAFADRLSVMLAQAAQARTQDLERWLRLEDRLRKA